jgi:transcriptional regulator with XRE-family HTH domain
MKTRSMATRFDAAVEGRRTARRTLATLGGDLRDARLGAGLSQRSVASAAGMSRAQLGRIERAEIAGLSLDQASRASSAVGLRLVIRTYPDGDPVRDAAHRALLERFRRLLPAGTTWRTEVPLPIPGDRRAWDAVATQASRVIALEAETRLTDLQALERRLALKRRDGGIDVVILVVADTRTNRRVLESAREELRTAFPLDRRAILGTMRTGQLPPGSGLLAL